MRKILRLAQRDYVAAVQTRGFLIGLILMPVLMGGSLIAMALLRNQVDTTDKRVVLIDRSGVVTQRVLEAAKTRNSNEVYQAKTGKKIHPAYLFETVVADDKDPTGQQLALSERIRKGELHAFVEVGSNVLHPTKDAEASHVLYHAKNAPLDDLRRWLADPINDQLRRNRLLDAGVAQDKVKDLFSWVDVEGMGLVERDAKTGKVAKAEHKNELQALGVPFMLQMILFMLFLMGTTPLLTAVMEEKAQRIAEVLLGSVTPFQFMMGKLVGGVAVALTASGVYIGGGVISLSSMAMADLIPYSTLPWLFAFLTVGMVMYGAIFAALGSACNDAKDAASLQMPGMLPLMIPMFMLGNVLREPNSPMITALSLFPPFTPSLMVLRQAMPGGVPAWQLWVGLIGTTLCAVFAVWAGGRIFRVGILLQGKRPSLAGVLRWAFRG